jgi:hypothetical protein
MDISSPFDTLFAEIAVERPGSEPIEELEPGFEESEVEEPEEIAVPVVMEPAPSVYRPFFSELALVPVIRSGAKDEELTTLESIDDSSDEEASDLIDAAEPDDGEGGAFIVIRDGLAYVSDSAYEEEAEAAENPTLRSLAEFVIGQRR